MEYEPNGVYASDVVCTALTEKLGRFLQREPHKSVIAAQCVYLPLNTHIYIYFVFFILESICIEGKRKNKQNICEFFKIIFEHLF